MSSIKDKLRTFSLSNFAIDNGTSIMILILMIVIFGFRSYTSMSKESYPEASLPTIYINTPYFGNSAAEIENLVARPMEKEISTISGIKNIKSTSIQDFSVILVEFEADEDKDLALRKVKDAVEKAKSELPNDLDQDPSVEEVNLSEFPIMTVNLSGNYALEELREYAETLQDEFEQLREINNIQLKGGLEREVKINIDLLKMQALQVSFNDVEQAIAQENMSMSAGEITNQNFNRSIRILGEFQNTNEIKNVVVKSEKRKPIYLRDFADVVFGFEDRESYARSNSLPVISLDIVKRKGGNVIDVAAKIRIVIEEQRVNFPPELNIALFNDTSVYTEESVSTLENSIISGVILVVLVLLFFLGLRNALFVGIAIPLSMLLGILWLDITGNSMNMIVFFGLILALGLLVDNAIVVVENIYRYMQEGYSGSDAAKYGAGEVAMPIIASTATTLAAFIPLAMWPGIMGEFMKFFPITLIAVLTSSLFVALVINPVLTSRFMKVDERADTRQLRRRKQRNVLIGAAILLLFAVAFHFIEINWARNIAVLIAGLSTINFFLFRPGTFYFQNRGLPALESSYKRFVKFILKGPGPIIMFGGMIALLIGSLMLLMANMPKVEFFPSGQPQYVNVFVDLPLGSGIEATNDVVKGIEEDVKQALVPYSEIVEEVLTQIGKDTNDPSTPPEPGVTPHKARITTSFVQYKERNGISTADAMQAIRDAVREQPGVSIVVGQNSDGPPTGLPISLELTGEDIDQLSSLSKDVIQYLNSQKVPGVEGLKADVRLAKPELEIKIDRESARRYGLSTAQIAMALRTSVFGKEVSKFKDGEDEYPIMVRLSKKYRDNVTALMNQEITFRNQITGKIVQIPISAVASYNYSTSYNAIKRKDQERNITVYSKVIQGYNTNEIVTELKQAMESFTMPRGVTYVFTGEQEQQAEDMAFLNGAFMLALFSIFIILVAQFNSIYSPFIIILSIVFSTIGVFLGYAITGKTIVVIFTGVGIISLAGIVVNNAIVLVDYINLVIQRKREEKGVPHMLLLEKSEIKDSIIQGGATRLRPVLLTAITTILGLVPLATGFNMNFFSLLTELDAQIYIGGNTTSLWGPLAWTVIYGMTFATFLTLVVVPAMYYLAYRIKYLTERKGILKKYATEEEV
ncbi:MAG: multidrug efflux pump [Saprospiraceae bacterium]|jgi:multidrug efflux pump